MQEFGPFSLANEPLSNASVNGLSPTGLPVSLPEIASAADKCKERAAQNPRLSHEDESSAATVQDAVVS